MTNPSLFDLPINILVTISNCLSSFNDLVRLAATSKAWRQIVRSTAQRRSNMPWLITFDMDCDVGNMNKFELYDLRFQQTYSLKKFTEQEEVRGLFFDADLHNLKYGWLLFSNTVGKNDGATISTMFFFYNPFCEKIIKVDPLDLDMPEASVWEATFTAPPSSSDCVMFVIWRDFCAQGTSTEYILYTCNIRDGRWNFQTINFPSEKSTRDVAYMDGTLYCVFDSVDSSWELGTIRFSGSSSSCVALDLDWAMVDLTASLRLQTLGKCQVRLVKYDHHDHDGKLLLAIQNVKEDCWHIYEYDSSQKDWAMIKSLGNQVLFLGRLGSGASLIVPAEGEVTELAKANMILCPDPDQIDHKGYNSYTCKTEGNWSFHGTFEWHNYKKGTDIDQFHIWIEPPLIN